jgi:hypothetical protein
MPDFGLLRRSSMLWCAAWFLIPTTVRVQGWRRQSAPPEPTRIRQDEWPKSENGSWLGAMARHVPTPTTLPWSLRWMSWYSGSEAPSEGGEVASSL